MRQAPYATAEPAITRPPAVPAVPELRACDITAAAVSGYAYKGYMVNDPNTRMGGAQLHEMTQSERAPT